jgi:hypothetical protein
MGHDTAHWKWLRFAYNPLCTAIIPTTLIPLKLTNMLYVPLISKNLLSVSQLIKDNDILVEFSHKSCFIKNQTS